MKKSIQQNPDVQSPNNLPYVPLKKKSKLMYHHQHNSILKQPSVIEQIPGKELGGWGQKNCSFLLTFITIYADVG